MLTVNDVLQLPIVRRGLPELLAGGAGLARELRWAHALDLEDPSDLLRGGELVLTTGAGARAAPARWVATLVEQDPAAIVVELGTTWRDMPRGVVEVCGRAGVPLVGLHRSVRFVDVTEAVHSAVLHEQFALLQRGEEIHRRFTELILQGRGVPEILAELSAAVGAPVVLEDAGHELVFYVSGAVGDDVALAAWSDVHRAEERGEEPGADIAVDVRLMDASWGRLLALAVDRRFTAVDRVAVERAALAVAIDLLGRQHDEQLRARSRGAFLSDLVDGRADEADARRRAEALGFAGRAQPPRGTLLPVVASWRRAAGRSGPRADRQDGLTWTRLSGELRTALSSTGLTVLLGPREVDLLVILGLGRAYDAALCDHVAGLFHGALERRALGPAEAALAIGAPALSWVAAGGGLRRAQRSAGASSAAPVQRWYDARRPGVNDLLHDLRETPALDVFVDEQLGPLLDATGPRARALLETLETYLRCGASKAQAARELHLERQSLYGRLARIEELLGVSLDDEDVRLGLHLALRAQRFRARRTAA